MDFTEGIDLIGNKLNRWWLAGIKMLPNFFLALIVLAVFLFGARVIRKLTNRVVISFSKSESLGGLISLIVYALMLVVGLMMALDIMSLDKTVSSLLAGVGIIGLALGFAFQDLTSNFISGAFMAFKRPFEVGHKVETNGFIGIIDHIHLRDTTLRTTSGLHVIIPNKDIFQKPIINYTRSATRRIELEFSVPVTMDLNYVENIIRDAIKKIKSRSSIDDIEFYYTSIEDPRVKLQVSFRINNAEPKGFFIMRHKAITAIYRAFADKNIIKVTQPTTAEPVGNGKPQIESKG
jgi:small conductance mechanosensitive channel